MSVGLVTALDAGRETKPSRPALVLVTVALGTMLAPLNSTMLAVALPAIRNDLDVSHAATGWLISSYLIAMAVTQPVAGRVGDQIGRRRVFQGGLVAFLFFSFAAALAPNFAALMVFRTLQAVSGAILIPNGMGMLRDAVPPNKLGRYSGINGSLIGSTAALGPVIGGLVLSFASWRWLFAANIVVIAAALTLSSSLRLSQRPLQGKVSIDWLGVALFAAMLAIITYALNHSGSSGLFALAAAIGASILAAGIFAWRQARTAFPAAEWRLFRTRTFAGASSHILLMNLAMYTTLLAIPSFLIDVQNRSAAVAGLTLGCMAALQAGTAPFAGVFCDRFGRRGPSIISSLLALLASVLLLVGVSRDVSVAYVVGALLLLGFGVGLGFVTAGVAALESAPRELSGSAAGTQSMMRYFGSIIGVGVLSGILDTKNDAVPEIATYRVLFGVIAAMVALSLVAAFMIRSRASISEVPLET